MFSLLYSSTSHIESNSNVNFGGLIKYEKKLLNSSGDSSWISNNKVLYKLSLKYLLSFSWSILILVFNVFF